MSKINTGYTCFQNFWHMCNTICLRQKRYYFGTKYIPLLLVFSTRSISYWTLHIFCELFPFFWKWWQNHFWHHFSRDQAFYKTFQAKNDDWVYVLSPSMPLLDYGSNLSNTYQQPSLFLSSGLVLQMNSLDEYQWKE